MTLDILCWEIPSDPTPSMGLHYLWKARTLIPLPTVQWAHSFYGWKKVEALQLQAEGNTKEEAIQNLKAQIKECLKQFGPKAELLQIEV